MVENHHRKEIAGFSLVLAQISRGVREIIEDLDYLRIKIGADKLNVLTPKVETRIRSGYMAAIPMKVEFIFQGLQLTITFVMGYPHSHPLIIEINDTSETIDVVNFQNKTTTLCNTKVSYDESYPSIKSILNHLEIIIQSQSGIYIDYNHELLLASNGMENANSTKTDHQNTSSSLSSLSFRCNKCRYILFSENDLHVHSRHNYTTNNLPTSTSCDDIVSNNNSEILPDEGATTYSMNNKSSPCTSYFLDDSPSWLQIKGQDISGKLICPKCVQKVGHWNWSGISCSCHEWITPAYQIIKSKVDPICIKNDNNLHNSDDNNISNEDMEIDSCYGMHNMDQDSVNTHKEIRINDDIPDNSAT